jgi:hypothetical protein
MTVEEAQAEILQYPLFQLYLYCDSRSRQPKKKVSHLSFAGAIEFFNRDLPSSMFLAAHDFAIYFIAADKESENFRVLVPSALS